MGADSLHRAGIGTVFTFPSHALVPPKFKISKGSVSIPPEMRKRGQARAKELGLSFSRYITLLLQNDLRAPDEPFVVLSSRRLTREDAEKPRP